MGKWEWEVDGMRKRWDKRQTSELEALGGLLNYRWKENPLSLLSFVSWRETF